MSGDTAFMCQAFVVGALITFTYDWLRILRRVIPHKQMAVSAEDLFFWLIWGVAVFLWMYRISNGGMRWYAVAGAMLGIGLYKKLLSGPFVKISAGVLEKVLKILCRVLAFLLRPIGSIWKKFGKARVCLAGKRRKVAGNLKIRLKSYSKALKIRLKKR